MIDLIPKNMTAHALALAHWVHNQPEPEIIVEARFEYGVWKHRFAGRWWTTSELAVWAGVTEPCVRNWRVAGSLAAKMRERGLY